MSPAVCAAGLSLEVMLRFNKILALGRRVCHILCIYLLCIKMYVKY